MFYPAYNKNSSKVRYGRYSNSLAINYSSMMSAINGKTFGIGKVVDLAPYRGLSDVIIINSYIPLDQSNQNNMFFSGGSVTVAGSQIRGDSTFTTSGGTRVLRS